jgi:hypothetical protein
MIDEMGGCFDENGREVEVVNKNATIGFISPSITLLSLFQFL